MPHGGVMNSYHPMKGRSGTLFCSMVVLVSGFSARPTLLAAVDLPAVFGDHMVLQQGRPVPVWGTAAKGEAVRVLLGDKVVASGVADSTGNWKLQLPSLPPGPVPDLTIEGENRIVLKDVLAGEVWLCSGQSNMRMTVSATPKCDYGGVVGEEKEVQAADIPGIRFFDGTWKVCSPETVGGAYAMAYFFGKKLHQELGHPVGLLQAAVGGSPIESWVAPSVWNDDLKRRSVEAYRPEYAIRMEDHEEDLRAWQNADAKRRRGKPNAPPSPEQYPANFSRLFERLIQPLVPYAIRGVLWYQGETNAWRSEPYRDLLAGFISSWRGEWQDPELPFLIVQLANWGQTEKYLRASGLWAELRAMQAEVVRETPHCGLVVTLDIGDTVNLHPRNKPEAGRRAALVALATVYDRDVPAFGPEPTGAAWTAENARISFKHVAQGLKLDAVSGGFEVAGDDGGKFTPAEARVDGDSVVVSTEGIKDPKVIRYAWKDNPEGLLRNSGGLPAAPFRIERP